MEMLRGERIAEADLTDWRKLAQALHAMYLVDDFSAGARFVAAVGEAGDTLGHHPRVTIGRGHVDLELVTDDAVCTADDGTEYVVVGDPAGRRPRTPDHRDRRRAPPRR